MLNTRKPFKATISLFDTKSDALQVLENIMRPDIVSALAQLVKNPMLMFQHVRVKSNLGDMMWISPLKFVVMSGHTWLLEVLRTIANKAGFSAAFNHQVQEVKQSIEAVESRLARRKL